MLSKRLLAAAAHIAPQLPQRTCGGLQVQTSQLALGRARYVLTKTGGGNGTNSADVLAAGARRAGYGTSNAAESVADAEDAQLAAAAAVAEASAAAANAATSLRAPHTYQPMHETLPTYLNPAHFHVLIRGHGTTFFAGVPDSLLKDDCSYITDHVPTEDHVLAANEGTALDLAAGHHLATGCVPCVYLQNSGLGNVVNPLLSLCSSKAYSIPVLLLIGWRGELCLKDEPQHTLQGKVTPSLLHEMSVPYEILPDYSDGAFAVLQKAYNHFKTESAPFALLIKKNTFEKYA